MQAKTSDDVFHNKAIVAGTLALLGTYSVEAGKSTRTIDLLTADEFRNSNPGASRDGPVVAMNVYRRAK